MFLGSPFQAQSNHTIGGAKTNADLIMGISTTLTQGPVLVPSHLPIKPLALTTFAYEIQITHTLVLWNPHSCHLLAAIIRNS